MPKVSVIIPNFNHAAYLKQRIDSVLNQTYQNFELIILDDCSTDNSKEIIEQYRNDTRIANIIYNTENSGSTFKQWDKGIALAKGEYIWIAESDDWCENNLLETLMQGLQGNENCVLAYCQSYCVTGDNNIKFQSNHTKLTEYINGKDFIKNYILPRNPIFNAGMAVWRRSVYGRISKEYQEYKLIGDYCFWIALCCYGDVFISGKLLNYFRAHDKSVSADSIKSGLAFIEQLPLLKRLRDKKIIDESDYLLSLKKSYSLFRLSEKNIHVENAIAIKKLFSSYSKTQYKLKLYFFEKLVQSSLKKTFKL